MEDNQLEAEIYRLQTELQLTQDTLEEIQRAIPTPERLREIACLLHAYGGVSYAVELLSLANKLEKAPALPSAKPEREPRVVCGNGRLREWPICWTHSGVPSAPLAGTPGISMANALGNGSRVCMWCHVPARYFPREAKNEVVRDWCADRTRPLPVRVGGPVAALRAGGGNT